MPGDRFHGARLRFARLFNELSPADLAERTGVTRQYIHGLEIDDRSPSKELVNVLAFVLHVAPGFFSRGVSTTVVEEYCHFRSRKMTPVFARQECIARGTLFDELMEHLDGLLRLPRVDIDPCEARDRNSIEEITLKYRKRWGLGEGPISNMCRVVEQRAGAVVTYFPGASEKVDAFSISRPRPIVVRNPAKQSSVRMRFDLAHELGHLIMHYGLETGDEITEEQANIFASAFLLPRRPFIAEFPHRMPFDWGALYEMKRRWKVSVAAILFRARDLGLIDPAQYRIACQHLSKTGQKRKERLDDEIPMEQPELLETALKKYDQLSNRSLNSLAQELEVTPLFLRRLAGFELISADEWDNDPSVVKLADYRNVHGQRNRRRKTP